MSRPSGSVHVSGATGSRARRRTLLPRSTCASTRFIAGEADKGGHEDVDWGGGTAAAAVFELFGENAVPHDRNAMPEGHRLDLNRV